VRFCVLEKQKNGFSLRERTGILFQESEDLIPPTDHAIVGIAERK